MKRIQISRPIGGEPELAQLNKVLDSGWWTGGEAVAEFERLAAEYVGAKYAVAVSSCTTGLHLALLACGVGPGDEVIVPAFTWCSTANAVEYCGAKPVFCDIDLETYNIPPIGWEGYQFFMPVHLFGLCAPIPRVDDYGAGGPTIIEDAACALGATYKGKKAGSLGDVGVFSFHPRKIISTGEGGMITTDDEGIAYECRKLRDHGAFAQFSNPQKWVPCLGYNYRMSAFQAAVGIAQMEKLEHELECRRAAARHPDKLPDWLRPPQAVKGHSYQAFVCLLTDDAPMSRDDLIAYMDSKGIECTVGTQCVPMLDYYRNKYGYKAGDFPNAEKAAAQTIALPIGAHMTDEDYERVIDALKEADDD